MLAQTLGLSSLRLLQRRFFSPWAWGLGVKREAPLRGPLWGLRVKREAPIRVPFWGLRVKREAPLRGSFRGIPVDGRFSPVCVEPLSPTAGLVQPTLEKGLKNLPVRAPFGFMMRVRVSA